MPRGFVPVILTILLVNALASLPAAFAQAFANKTNVQITPGQSSFVPGTPRLVKRAGTVIVMDLPNGKNVTKAKPVFVKQEPELTPEEKKIIIQSVTSVLGTTHLAPVVSPKLIYRAGGNSDSASKVGQDPIEGLPECGPESPVGWSFDCGVPPDITLAVGPDHVIEMVNVGFAIWTKDGTFVKNGALSDFFNTGGDRISDPKVLFDTASSRFFASIADVSTNNVIVAVSATSDPTGSWSLYPQQFSNCPDNPVIGTSDDKLVISVSVFSTGCVKPFLGWQWGVLDKKGMVSSPQTGFYGNFLPTPDNTNFSVHPAQSESSTSDVLAVEKLGGNSTIRIFTFTGIPPNAGVNAPSSAIAIGAGCGSASSPTQCPMVNGTQPGTTKTVNVGDDRMGEGDAAYVPSDGVLWLGFNEGCNPAGDSMTESCFHLVQVDSLTSKIVQEELVGINSKSLFYPALRIDSRGNLDVVFGFSSSVDNPSIAETSLLAAAPTILEPAVVVFQGDKPEDYYGRYGDYFGAAVDPSDPHVVWTAGEYVTSGGFLVPNHWHTFIDQMAGQYTPPGYIDTTSTSSCQPNPNEHQLQFGSMVLHWATGLQLNFCVISATNMLTRNTVQAIMTDGPVGATFNSQAGSRSLGFFQWTPLSAGTFVAHFVTRCINFLCIADSLPLTVTIISATSATCTLTIATAGSELAPLAQSFRSFRDNSIEKTRAGSQFMIAFNAWYYSFSPYIAYYIASHPLERTTVKYLSYPLFGILYAAYYSYALVAPLSTEAAAVVAGIVAALLIGLVYVAPIAYLTMRLIRRGKRVLTPRGHHAIPSCIWFAGSLLMIWAAYQSGFGALMAIGTANLTLSALSFGSLLGTAAFMRVYFHTNHARTMFALRGLKNRTLSQRSFRRRA